MRLKLIRSLSLLMCMALLLGFSACASTGIYIPGPMVQEGPPPHAPAHGYRAKHTYYYYPDAEVYFDVGRSVYFYMHGDNWRMTTALPGSLSLHLGDHVRLDMNTDKPYVDFHQHRKKYPPGQMKVKKMGKKR